MTTLPKPRPPKPLKLWKLDPITGNWKDVITSDYDVHTSTQAAQAFTKLANQYQALHPDDTYKTSARKPRKRKPNANKVKAPEASATFTTPRTERERWDVKAATKLQRQHHQITPDEAVALGLEGLQMSLRDMDSDYSPFVRATGLRGISLREASGTVLFAVAETDLKPINGYVPNAFDIMASGPTSYDVRALHHNTKDDPTLIPDDQFVGGLRLLQTVQDVPISQMLATIESLLGYKVDDPVRNRRLRLDKARKSFNGCPCEACRIARAAAAANGTDIIAERLKASDAGDFSELAADFDPKIQAARKRSTVVTPEKVTMN